MDPTLPPPENASAEDMALWNAARAQYVAQQRAIVAAARGAPFGEEGDDVTTATATRASSRAPNTRGPPPLATMTEQVWNTSFNNQAKVPKSWTKTNVAIPAYSRATPVSQRSVKNSAGLLDPTWLAANTANVENPETTIGTLTALLDDINEFSDGLKNVPGATARKAELRALKRSVVERLKATFRPPAVKPIKGEQAVARMPAVYQPGTLQGQATYGYDARRANAQQLANRMQQRYSGQGAYFGRTLGERLGRAIPRFGAAVAPALGNAFSRGEDWLLDKAIGAAKTYRGSGAYIRDGPAGHFEDFDGDGVDDATGELLDYAEQRRQALKRRREEGEGYADDFHGRTDVVGGAPSSGPVLRTNQLIDPHSLFSRKPPVFYTVGDETGDMIFTHREYIMDITPTSTNFQTQLIMPLNPGLRSSFPLLSRFAEHFSQYKFTQLIIRFRSLITEGNSTAAGCVMMTTLYNPDESEMADKRAIENSEYSVSGKVTDTLDMGIECDRKKMAQGEYLYVRLGDVGNAAKMDYDMGKVQIATQGVPAGLTCGEVWGEYTVRMSKLSLTDARPLQVGDGMGATVIFPAPATDMSLLWNAANCWAGALYSGGMPVGQVKYPLAIWGVANTVEPGEWPAAQTSALIGDLSENTLLMQIPTNVWSTPSFENGGHASIASWNQSADITAYQVNADANKSPNLALVFNAVQGAEYVFKYTQHISGGLSQNGTDPVVISNMPYPPSTGHLGVINSVINSGNIKYSNTTKRSLNVRMGQAWYNDIAVANLGPARNGKVMNMSLSGFRMVATGSGPCRVQILIDGTGTFPNNIRCLSSAWQFTRVA